VENEENMDSHKETKDLSSYFSTSPVQELVKKTKIVLDSQNLPNPYDDTDVHEHKCANCNVYFTCVLPLCDGGLADPDLCQDCYEAIGEVW
jgi:hypothetical protein